MFVHIRQPLHEVKVDQPDPQFAEKLLEQFGGATGELSACLTYFTQSFHQDDKGIRDMLLDIATEEMGHLEMVGMLIEQHTKKAAQDAQDKAYQSTLFAVRGMGPHVVDSQGSFWDGRYVSEGGSPVRDLRADIAAEAGALQTYETLLKYAPDEGTKKTLRHLATREVAHTHMFMEALKSMDKLTEPMFGDLQPDDTVDVYYNLSHPAMGGDSQRGPWNREPTFKYVPDPVQNSGQEGLRPPGPSSAPAPPASTGDVHVLLARAGPDRPAHVPRRRGRRRRGLGLLLGPGRLARGGGPRRRGRGLGRLAPGSARARHPRPAPAAERRIPRVRPGRHAAGRDRGRGGRGCPRPRD